MIQKSLTSMLLLLILTITWLTVTTNENIYVNAAAAAAAATTTTTTTTTTAQPQQNNNTKVAAGGGNGTVVNHVFNPQDIEINAGQSVTWLNPTKVGEPHTVTFVLENDTMTGVVSPLAVSNTTKFMPLPPGSNNEPVLLPGQEGMNTIIAINARTFNPVVIDSSDNVKFMNPNANYSMNGSEKFVNSGWFLPEGQEQLYPGSGNAFTVTFEKPGTYSYICILHPWMIGSVLVK